jgi:hypothetical protein
MIRPLRSFATLFLVCVTFAMTPALAESQEARRRWERMCQIRAEKFDLVLPGAMADNDIDMWIVVMREGLLDPLWEALGRGYVGGWAYYVFSAEGERVHRSAFGVGGYMLEQCGVYDEFSGAGALADFVRDRDPMRIGVTCRPVSEVQTDYRIPPWVICKRFWGLPTPTASSPRRN